MVQYIIPPIQLKGIAYKIHVVSGNIVAGLHVKIIQHVSCFTYRVQETKTSMQLINKQVLIKEPVLQNTLVFHVEAYLKLVLGYFSKIGHYKVDFCNVYIKLHQISMEIEVILKQEIIELIKLIAAENVGDVGFSFS